MSDTIKVNDVCYHNGGSVPLVVDDITDGVITARCALEGLQALAHSAIGPVSEFTTTPGGSASTSGN